MTRERSSCPMEAMDARRRRLGELLTKDPDLERWQLCERLGIDRMTCLRWCLELNRKPGNWSGDIKQWLRRVGRKRLGEGFSRY